MHANPDRLILPASTVAIVCNTDRLISVNGLDSPRAPNMSVSLPFDDMNNGRDLPLYSFFTGFISSTFFDEIQTLLMVGYAIGCSSEQILKPKWLQSLLSEKFFDGCMKHPTTKKNERNIFCMDCSFTICQHCVCSHSRHQLLQVRRYVYHDVIRLHDMQKLLDCSLVQTYIINSARVVFLNQRPQQRPAKGLLNACDTCDRSLQESYQYCSIACKVDAAVKKRDLSYLVPKADASYNTSSSGIDEELSRNSDEENVVTSVLMIPAPKRIRTQRYGGGQYSPKSVIPHYTSRRKSTPHRSPIF